MAKSKNSISTQDQLKIDLLWQQLEDLVRLLENFRFRKKKVQKIRKVQNNLQVLLQPYSHNGEVQSLLNQCKELVDLAAVYDQVRMPYFLSRRLPPAIVHVLCHMDGAISSLMVRIVHVKEKIASGRIKRAETQSAKAPGTNAGEEEKAKPEGEWSKPMTKSKMMSALGLGDKAFKTFVRSHELRQVSNNRQLWQIRLDEMDKNNRQRFEKI